MVPILCQGIHHDLPIASFFDLDPFFGVLVACDLARPGFHLDDQYFVPDKREEVDFGESSHRAMQKDVSERRNIETAKLLFSAMFGPFPESFGAILAGTG